MVNDMTITNKQVYITPAVKEVSILPQSMLATSSQVETLGERKDDMEWANSLRNGTDWSDPWE